jgi:hypothetical protein
MAPRDVIGGLGDKFGALGFAIIAAVGRSRSPPTKLRRYDGVERRKTY